MTELVAVHVECLTLPGTFDLGPSQSQSIYRESKTQLALDEAGVSQFQDLIYLDRFKQSALRRSR